MARTFNGSTSNYLSGSPPVSGPPLTMACWFWSSTASPTNQALMCIGGALQFHSMRIRDAPDLDVIGLTRASTSAAFADTTAQWATSTWHHAATVFAASNSRTAYLDGSGGSTNTTTVTPSSATAFLLGQQNYFGTEYPMTGRVAWPCVWGAALSSGEIAALAGGAHPFLVRPASIVWFGGDLHSTGGEIDLIGGNDLTENGTVGVAESPMVALAEPWMVNYTPGAVGGGFQPAWARGSTVTIAGGIQT